MREAEGLFKEVRPLPHMFPEHGFEGRNTRRNQVELVKGVITRGAKQMAMTDPIGDMLTRMKNAMMSSYDTVDIPGSKLKMNIAKVLKSEGFIKNYRIVSEGPRGTIRVFLKYDEKGVPVIGGLKRVSKPSRRFYTKSDKIPKVLGGLGVNILSTSRGVMTDREARKTGVGGEVLCAVW